MNTEPLNPSVVKAILEAYNEALLCRDDTSVPVPEAVAMEAMMAASYAFARECDDDGWDQAAWNAAFEAAVERLGR